MKILFSFFLLLILCFETNAQIVLDKTSHDFGDLYAHSERFVDFYFKNTGSAKAYILRVEKQANTVYQISSSTILPDSSVVVRIQVSEKKKGSFSIQVPVYLSDRSNAVTLKLTGNIKELTPDLSALTDCPNFSRKPSDGNPTDFMLTVVTIDKNTKKLLDKSRVEILQSGLLIGDWRTDKEGKIQRKIPLGFTYFYASHEGYKPAEMGAYVNFKRNYIVVELEKEPEPIVELTETRLPEVKPPREVVNKPPREPKVIPPQAPEPVAVQKPVPMEIDIEIDNRKPDTPAKVRPPKNNKPDTPQQVNNPEPIPVVKPTEPNTEKVPKTYHVPSNIVFVLDVSWSMNKEERLELMKLALISLLEQLDDQDQVTVVTYGNNAEVIIPTTKGSNKDQIIELVSKIKGGGMTAGGQGIKLGYNMAIRGEIPNGNNQVIVITDGAFNKDSKDYERTVTRNSEKGYVLSVVGIKNKPEDVETMTQIAQLGKGRFIAIESIADARTKLFDEMQQASLRVD